MFDKKVISSIVIALILAFVISKITNFKNNDLLYKHTFISKTHTPKKYKIIIAGDSRIYRGVSPDEIKKYLKCDAINLGYSSAGFNKTLFELIDEKLDSLSDKKIIILGITPWSLTPEAVKNEHIIQEQTRKREEILSDKYFFKFKNSFNILSPVILEKKYIARQKFIRNYQEEYHENGWIASWYVIPNKYKAIDEYLKSFDKNKISEKIENDFFLQIKKWRKKGIDIYGFYPPSSFDIEVLENNFSGFSRKKFVEDFVKKGGKWLNVGKNYSSYDGSHLEKQSAIKLSKKIGYLISENKFSINYNDKLNDYLCKNPDYKHSISFKKSDLSKFIINYNDSFVNIVNKKNVYSKTFEKQISNFDKIPKKICITAEVMISDNNKSKLVCSIENNKKSIQWNALKINFIKPNKWQKIEFTVNVSEEVKKQDFIKIYFMNNYLPEIYIKNINISVVL